MHMTLLAQQIKECGFLCTDLYDYTDVQEFMLLTVCDWALLDRQERLWLLRGLVAVNHIQSQVVLVFFVELLRHEVRCCFSIVYFQLSGYGLYQYKHTSGIVRSKKCFGPFLPMLYFLFLNLRTPAYFFCLLFMIFFLSFFVS